jgi:hypothetical protein
MINNDATALILRKGTTIEHDAFTGLNGEITYDTDKHQLVVHDGVTIGGWDVPVVVRVPGV